eukprot:gnl/Chilomastix_cuspidata/4689.p1 GENE.gnl/Chilomastix_cuspidata/4689~~gnl/Chilomastix_cuspidata/4689.p1  ORF type:complete len:792 (-),score=262.73 gnl/Chilomastix_cuspidata/4689:258-2633(-)
MSSLPHLIIEKAPLEKVRAFVEENRSTLFEADKSGFLPVHCCAFYGNFLCFIELIRCGADPYSFTTGIDKKTCLGVAIENERVEFARNVLSEYPKLLAHDVHEPNCALLMLSRTRNETLKLHCLDVCRGVCDLSPIATMRDAHGFTLLHWSAFLGASSKFVRFLLDLGADPLACDGKGFTPLHRMACSKNYSTPSSLVDAEDKKETVRLLLSAGFQSFKRSSARSSPFRQLRAFLSHPVAPSQCENTRHLVGCSMLQLACSQGNFPLIATFASILAGVPSTAAPSPRSEISSELEQNFTDAESGAERLLALRHTPRGLELLLRLAFVDRDAEGKTALHWVVTTSDTRAVGMLLGLVPWNSPKWFLRSVFFATDVYGRTPLHAACHAPCHAPMDQLLFAFQKLTRLRRPGGERCGASWRFAPPAEVLGIALSTRAYLAARCLVLEEPSQTHLPTVADVSCFSFLTAGRVPLKLRQSLRRRGVGLVNVRQYAAFVARSKDVRRRPCVYTSRARGFWDRNSFLLAISLLYASSIVLGARWFSQNGGTRPMLSYAASMAALFVFHLVVARLDPGVASPAPDMFGARSCAAPGVRTDLLKGIVTGAVCPTCLVEKGPRGKHCPHCNHCVEGFDHCCPYIGGDVGARNHRAFYVLLVAGALLNAAWAFRLVVSFVRALEAALNAFLLQRRVRFRRGAVPDVLRRPSVSAFLRSEGIRAHFPALYLFMWHLIIALWCASLFVDQTRNICTSRTTNQVIKAEAARPLISIREDAREEEAPARPSLSCRVWARFMRGAPW